MKELEEIIEKFFSKESSALLYYNLNQQLFSDVVKNVKPYERPDILSIFKNKIVGIEHFEFDSFNRTSKGSEYRTNEFKIQKRFEKIMNDELKCKNFVSMHDKITGNSNMKNYFDNFQKAFLNHYNKIDDYVDHIKEEFDCSQKEIHICFFAEDVSPLGSVYIKDEKIDLLTPLFSDTIIEMLKNSPKVEYLIIGTYALSEYKLVIIENKIDVLEKYKNERPKIKESDFQVFKPETIGFAGKIPMRENKSGT